jgi:hypothetical protein
VEGAVGTLVGHLHRWERRRRAAVSLRWGAWGLAAGLLIALLIAIAARIWPLLTLPWPLALAGLWGLVGVIVALVAVWLWPRSELEQARFFDQCLGLKERISTALEIEAGTLSLPSWLKEEQLTDALASAERADGASALPLRLVTRDWLPAALSLVLLAAALWLPNPMQEVLADRAAVREEIEEQVEELEALREEIAADPQLSEEDQGQLLELLDGAIEELESGDLTREEALAELTETADRLRELASSEAEGQEAGLEGAAEGLRNSPLTSALAQALIDGDYQLAAEVLEDLSNELGEALTREQELELAEQLAEAAAALAESNPELAEKLARAAEAIQAGDIAAAREALAQASGTMGQTGQQIAAANAARNAAGQLAQSGQQIAQVGGGGGQGGEGSSTQPGEDGQGGGAGRGEGDGAAEGGPAGPMETDNAPGDGGIRAFEPIYAPQRLGGEGGPEMELPQSGDPGELVRELASNPEIGQSTVPYNLVYANYVDAANQALQEQHIPLGLRGYVRDYFSSLEP